MGDEYVKKEFRAHQVLPEDSTFHEPFAKAWSEYCEQLESFKPMEGSKGWSKDSIREEMRLGKDLSEEDMAALSEEQREQLGRLKSEALDVTDKLYNES